MEKYYLGIDLGGTRLRVFHCHGETGVILGRDRLAKGPFADNGDGTCPLDHLYQKNSLPDRPAAYMRDKVLEYLDKRDLSRQSLAGIGISVPGKITRGNFFFSANAPARYLRRGEGDTPQGVDVVSRLSSTFPEVEIKVENDATATALAQARYWKARGFDDKRTFYITISTGLGGGSVYPIPCEVGHTCRGDKFAPLAPICGCGDRACLEAYVSGTGLVNRYRQFLRAARETPDEVEKWAAFEEARWREDIDLARLVHQAAERGRDIEDSCEIYREVDRDNWKTPANFEAYLVQDGLWRFSQTCFDLAMVFGLDRIGVGGGVADNNRNFIFKWIGHYLEILHISDHMLPVLPKVVSTPLGKEANDYGALCLVKEPRWEYLG